MITRLSLIVVIVLLSIAVLADIGAITVGGLFTADSYYLPLREIDVGKSRDAIDTMIIKTHTNILKYQHRQWVAIHGVALAFAVVGLFACKSRPQLPGNGETNA